jgi:hypothetical protein
MWRPAHGATSRPGPTRPTSGYGRALGRPGPCADDPPEEPHAGGPGPSAFDDLVGRMRAGEQELEAPAAVTQ